MRYIVTSDIHLRHKNTPTQHIIESFKSTIMTDAQTDIDVLFIIGDLFDQLVSMNTTEAREIVAFLIELIAWCARHSIKLRVLEGTSSHDLGQSQILVKLNERAPTPCELRYIAALEVEYMREHDTHILYIPDEWCHSDAELIEQITAKYAEHNIAQADIAMLHGQFKYQVAGFKTSAYCYDEEYFHQIVKGYIHIGHHHVESSLMRIRAQGSLDRLCHGEEGDKGCDRFDDGVMTRLVNPNAYTYTTLNITPSWTLERLDKKMLTYKPGSFIRLSIERDHPLNVIFPELCMRYEHINLKRKIKGEASDSESFTYITTETEINLSTGASSNFAIYDQLKMFVESHPTLTEIERSRAMQYIRTFDFTPTAGSV